MGVKVYTNFRGLSSCKLRVMMKYSPSLTTRTLAYGILQERKKHATHK